MLSATAATLDDDRVRHLKRKKAAEAAAADDDDESEGCALRPSHHHEDNNGQGDISRRRETAAVYQEGTNVLLYRKKLLYSVPLPYNRDGEEKRQKSMMGCCLAHESEKKIERQQSGAISTKWRALFLLALKIAPAKKVNFYFRSCLIKPKTPQTEIRSAERPSPGPSCGATLSSRTWPAACPSWDRTRWWWSPQRYMGQVASSRVVQWNKVSMADKMRADRGASRACESPSESRCHCCTWRICGKNKKMWKLCFNKKPLGKSSFEKGI